MTTGRTPSSNEEAAMSGDSHLPEIKRGWPLTERVSSWQSPPLGWQGLFIALVRWVRRG